MKTSSDPRHKRRKEAVKELFAWSFQDQKPRGGELTRGAIAHLAKINKLIIEAAPQWPLEQINRIDLAILRLAVYELKIVKKEPVKVIIDEAVELAKEFGGESSPGFVNGVLGHIVKENESGNA